VGARSNGVVSNVGGGTAGAPLQPSGLNTAQCSTAQLMRWRTSLASPQLHNLNLFTKGIAVMKPRKLALALAFFFTALCSLSTTPALAQDGPFGRRAPSCSNGTASGTYGYRMSGVIVGVGPILVNGLFTHHPDGTMSGKVHLTIAGQQIPNADWANGTFQTNNDCTGSGSFFVAALNQQITYNFIATDGGNQIDLINTNAGNAFNGYGRRISQHGRAPSCNNGTILGSYGFRLDGSIPGVPSLFGAGIETYALDAGFKGVFSGADTNSFNGQIVPRTFQGTYQVNSDCTGIGKYSDSLGNTINYVFVVVEGGQEMFFQGTDPGIIVSGSARRVR